MKKYIYFFIFIALFCSTAYAGDKKALFDDYSIYSKEIEKVINNTKKEVYSEIDEIKKMMVDNKKEIVTMKLDMIHDKIIKLDEYIKKSSQQLKTENMKNALTYPVYELSFYEKVIKETADLYYKQGNITKKEIKEIEKKYKNEETEVKKQADIIKHDFLKAVFE